jgi:thiamine-phosphate pyrophosphorylase
MRESERTPPQLYLISPPQIDLETFSTQLEMALTASPGTVGAFQLRLKDNAPPGPGRLTHIHAKEEHILYAAKQLKRICHAHQVAFILNDSPQLALEANADGVHLGQEDGSVAEARALLGPEKVIGVSCHASRHLAMEAGEFGADYVAFGAFHPTTSKTPESLAKWGTPDIELLSWWSTFTTLPCVAIGGMTPDNCGPMVAAGADFIAALSSVWNHPHGPAEAVKAFAASFARIRAE